MTDAFCAVRRGNMYVWFTLLAGLAALSLPFLKKLFPYLGEEFTYIVRSVRFGGRLLRYRRLKPFYSIVDCFLDAARRHPDKTFVHFEGRQYSYGAVDKQSNKVARALQAEARLKEGQPVSLFVGNEPCLIWTWLALAKLGCPAALLNFNIRSKSLLHCFSCCGAKAIIASAGKTRNRSPPHRQPSALLTHTHTRTHIRMHGLDCLKKLKTRETFQPVAAEIELAAQKQKGPWPAHESSPLRIIL